MLESRKRLRAEPHDRAVFKRVGVRGMRVGGVNQGVNENSAPHRDRNIAKLSRIQRICLI